MEPCLSNNGNKTMTTESRLVQQIVNIIPLILEKHSILMVLHASHAQKRLHTLVCKQEDV